MTSVIEIEGLWKQYRLGTIGHGALYKDIQSWWARKTGKDDPNKRLGEGSPFVGDRFWALRDVSINVQAGEVLGIIGRNGAGKSTLLKILSRVTAPTKGTIRVQGRIASLLEVGTGFHPELTGRENVFLNGAIMGMPRAEVKAKFDEIAAFSGVDRFIDTPVKRYSSGMYVRLAFAVAAHLEPDILVVDEVLAVGDAEFQKKCLGKMQSVSEQQGRTVLFVSHNMAALRSLCTRCVVINEGMVTFVGTPAAAISFYLGGGREDVPSSVVFLPPQAEVDFHIRAAALVDATGSPKSTFTLDEEIRLIVEYEFYKPLDGMTLGYELCLEGEKVLTSYDTDALADPSFVRAPGRYRAEVRLPSSLKPGNYFFGRIFIGRIKKTSLNDRTSPVIKEGLLPFSIESDLEIVKYRSFGAGNSGYFRSRESWQTNG